MRSLGKIVLGIGFLFLSACGVFQARQPEPVPMVPPKPLALPVGKNWQVQEEAPKLTDERGKVYFQTEQSVQPEGAPPSTTEDKRRIQTPR